jgi:hypothetical protein
MNWIRIDNKVTSLSIPECEITVIKDSNYCSAFIGGHDYMFSGDINEFSNWILNTLNFRLCHRSFTTFLRTLKSITMKYVN